MESNAMQHQADIQLTNEMIKLCQEGEAFYTQAISLVDDYNLKRIFVTQASLHQRLLMGFIPQRQYGISPIPYDTQSLTPQLTYAQTENLLRRHHIPQAIARLIEVEQRVLARLKLAVRQAHHPRLTSQLAEGAAWLQISCDEMASLSHL